MGKNGKYDSKDVTSQVVQRGENVVYGSRDGGDRRGEKRGLKPGRRLVDHHEVRSRFNARLRTLVTEGLSPKSIARVLNDEDFLTAEGAEWSEIAITQILEKLRQQTERDAWLPDSLLNPNSTGNDD